MSTTVAPPNTSANGTADNNDTTPDPVGVEDLIPVRSRISWGAIFGGAVVALAIYFVLTLLGTALGITVATQTNVRNSETGMNAVFGAGIVWAVAATILALFAGGWVASQLSVGESPREAAVYGVVVWGTVLAMLLFLLTAGVRSGFSAMIGMATVADMAERHDPGSLEESARRGGYSQEQIERLKDAIKGGPARAVEALKDPETRQQVGNQATSAAWWSLVGTVLSMGAAVCGALAGAGPKFRLLLATYARRQPVRV